MGSKARRVDDGEGVIIHNDKEHDKTRCELHTDKEQATSEANW